LPSFANKIVDEIDVMARMKEMPDPSGAGLAIEGSGISSDRAVHQPTAEASIAIRGNA
jgi:hypothetical protein